jgi:hypothetical protein
MTTVEKLSANPQPGYKEMPKAQIITTETGDELVVLTRADYEALVSAAGKAREAELAQAKNPDEGINRAFGLWRDRKIDGLEYERKLRDEW